jgi:hypothetical protein
MVPSLLQLLRRDHDELDGVRLGLAAHVEAEDIVVDAGMVPALTPGHAELARAIADRRREHRDQEHALGALLRSQPGTSLWRDRALHLIAMVRRHRDDSETVLREALDRIAQPERLARLAGRYATERMRQLAMLVPSGPMPVPEEMLHIAQASA